MSLRDVKARSICHVYTEIHFVTYNRHIHKNVREVESNGSVCSQVLSLNTENPVSNFLLIISQQQTNI